MGHPDFVHVNRKTISLLKRPIHGRTPAISNAAAGFTLIPLVISMISIDFFDFY